MELRRRAHEALDLLRDPACDLSPDLGALRFGDVVRLLHGDGEAPPVALCTAPSGCSEEAEALVARELRSSGRVPDNFLAVTAPPVEDGVVGQRAIWELYRANPLDGVPGDTVHYGQLLRLGQRHVDPTDRDSEVLLVSEPPSRGGGSGAPYIVFGRPAGYGHPDPRAEEKKAFDDVFRLMPCLAAAAEEARGAAPGQAAALMEGQPVDMRRPAMLVPAAPFAHLHGPRVVSVSTNTKVVGCARFREVQVEAVGGGRARELLVEASAMPEFASGDLPAAWRIERLVGCERRMAACEQRRAEAHGGLPRALLGRALPSPPDHVRAGAEASEGARESNFARWEHLRNALLPKIRSRGGLGFSAFRKALAANRPVVTGHLLGSLVEAHADDPLGPDERFVIPIEQVCAVLRVEYKVHVADEDLALLAAAFSVRGSAGHWHEGNWEEVSQLLDKHGCSGGKGDLVDADLFADALRGEPSPARHRILCRIYDRLQEDAGVSKTTALAARWVEERLARALPKDLPGASTPELMPEQLINALPLLRSHTSITRFHFCRWLSDTCFHLPTHPAFLDRMKQVWGPFPALLSDEEARLWSLQSRPPPPAMPHMPPFVGKFPPIAPGFPFGIPAGTPDRGDATHAIGSARGRRLSSRGAAEHAEDDWRPHGYP